MVSAENSAPSSPTPEAEANYRDSVQRRLVFDEKAGNDDDEPFEDETVVSAEPANKPMNGVSGKNNHLGYSYRGLTSRNLARVMLSFITLYITLFSTVV